MSNGKTQHLAEKVVVMTGAGRSIGRAHALRFAEEGARVVVNDVGEQPDGNGRKIGTAESVVAEIREAGGQAVANTDSIATMEGGQRLVETALDSFGRVDILINNAGVFRNNLIFDLSEDDFDAVVSVHLKGTFITTKHVAPIFREQRSGVIINTGSNSGQGHYGNSIYSAAKEGIVGFTRSIARDLGPYNVRCNVIRPRAASTNVLANAKTDAPSRIMQMILQAEEEFGFPSAGDVWAREFMGRAAAGGFDPFHISDFAVWLCTDAAANVNGMDFQVFAGEIGLMSEPQPVRSIFRKDRWTIEELNDSAVRQYLVGHLRNRFLPRDKRRSAEDRC